MIPDWIKDAGAKTEADSERDGAFSYSSEVHAFVIAMAVGFVTVFPSSRLRRFVYEATGLDGDWSRSKAMKEVKKESWYALGGMMLGVGSAIVAIAAVVALLGKTALALSA